MDTLGKRVRYAIDLRGTTQKQAEIDAGMSGGYLSRVISEQRKKLGFEAVARLAKALRVNHEWLASGVGPIEPSLENVHPRVAALAPIVPEATVEILENASRMKFFGGGSLDSMSDEAVVQVIRRSVQYQRDLEATFELDALKRARLGPAAEEQEALEEAERDAFRAKKPGK